MKFNHRNDQSEEIIAIRIKVRKLIGEAKYKIAYKYLLLEQKKFPKSYYIASMLATLNAEDAFILNDRDKKIAFNIAANKLKSLLKYSRSCSPDLRNRNINEYYWFSEQHLKQYKFGNSRVEAGDPKGHYSAGVGSTNYAYKLALSGKLNESLRWADKAIHHWEFYFKLVTKKYHDPWYWYSLALAISQKFKGSQKAMIKSAKLSGKDIHSNPAFKKLNKMIDKIKEKQNEKK